jgi:hypothetical protein
MGLQVSAIALCEACKRLASHRVELDCEFLGYCCGVWGCAEKMAESQRQAKRWVPDVTSSAAARTPRSAT